MLLVRVLGPTGATRADGAEVDLGARRHAELLAILAAHRGRQVPAETLADLLWRGAPPPSAGTTLQGYVARLRRTLEPGRPGAEATSIVTVGAGYRLDATTDAALFEADVRHARELLATAPDEAARVLAEALGRWRGGPFADVRDLDAIAPEVERLDELHVVARELAAEAALAAGADAEAVPDLRRLVAEHPLRERPPVLLATALYRSGRQADALAVVRALRGRLVDELGVDPGHEVVAVEERILRQDPELLARPAAPTGRTTPPFTAGATAPAAPRETAPVADRAAAGLPGRDDDLAALAHAWRRARWGVVTTVVVRGEAGIGKTRLVQHLADTVVLPDGGAARWGRCSAAPGSPAFWPWTQVIGELAAPADIEAGRFALALDVAARLTRLATTADAPGTAGAMGAPGALVVLDDAHWADPDTLVVLEIVLDALGDVPLLLVLTARDDLPRAPDELGRVLAACARRPGHRDVRLGGLTDDDTAALLATLGGPTPTAQDAARLRARTGGNPYFLRSLASLGPDAELPHDVRDTVRARLAALPAGGTDLVRALALVPDLPVGSAVAATGLPADATGAALDAAVRAGLLEEPAPGRLRVAHDIVRESVLSGLGPAERTALHARLAEVLTSATAVAEHRLAAASGGVDDRAAGAALAAAREALAGAALDDAVSWAQRGARVAADDEIRADLHRVAGTAARRAGRLELSRDELEREAAIARRHGDWARLAEAALTSVPGGIGGYWSLLGPLLGRSTLLDEALTRLDDVPSALRARLLAAEATQRAGTDVPGAAELAERALAEAGDDVDARARALVADALARWTPDAAPRRLEQVEELVAIAARVPGLEATAAHLQRCVLLELGLLADSAAASRRFAAIAERTRDPDLALLDVWWRAGLELARGRSDEAFALAEQAAAIAAAASPAAQSLDAISRATVQGIAAWHAGRLADVVGDAADLADSADAAFLLVVALGHAEAGNREVALPVVDRLLARPPQGPRRASWLVMLTAALVALSDAGRLEPLVDELRAYGDRFVVLWPGVVCLGPARLYLGGALAVTGRHDEARAALLEALAQAGALGAAPFVERARRLLDQLPD